MLSSNGGFFSLQKHMVYGLCCILPVFVHVFSCFVSRAQRAKRVGLNGGGHVYVAT